MHIKANIKNSFNKHVAIVKTNGKEKFVAIPSRDTGFGSSLNGGELLMLALATCFCNDIYREATKMNIIVKSVEVEVNGHFGAEGEAGRDFTYKAKLKANASDDEIKSLLKHTDTVAEIQNTLRKGLDIRLEI